MDLSNLIKNEITANRVESLKSSPQLTLGELLHTLKAIPDEDNDKCVTFDFGTAVPTEFDSWRGVYAEIALGYELTGYDATGDVTPDPKLSEFIKKVETAIGSTYTGWKGGDFTMSKHTPVWVANNGNAGNTGIVGVKDNGYSVTLQTWYCEC